MQEWERLAQENPYFPQGEIPPPDADSTGTDEAADRGDDARAAADASGAAGQPGLLDSASAQDDGGGMPSLVVIMVALAVGAALCIGLAVLAIWVYRRVQFKKQQVPHLPCFCAYGVFVWHLPWFCTGL